MLLRLRHPGSWLVLRLYILLVAKIRIYFEMCKKNVDIFVRMFVMSVGPSVLESIFMTYVLLQMRKNIAARAAFVLKCLIYNLLRAAMFM